MKTPLYLPVSCQFFNVKGFPKIDTVQKKNNSTAGTLNTEFPSDRFGAHTDADTCRTIYPQLTPTKQPQH